MAMIVDPAVVEADLAAGHLCCPACKLATGRVIWPWEPENSSAIGTLVERSTRFLILLSFPDGVTTTEGVRRAITAALADLPAELRRTVTWDQGK